MVEYVDPTQRQAGVQDHHVLRPDAAARARRRCRCGRPRACWSRRSRAGAIRSSTASGSTGSSSTRSPCRAAPGASTSTTRTRTRSILFVASDEPALAEAFDLYKKWGRDKAGERSRDPRLIRRCATFSSERHLRRRLLACGDVLRASVGGSDPCEDIVDRGRLPSHQHEAVVAHRLSRRRPGLGRGHDAVSSATCAGRAAPRSTTSPTRARRACSPASTSAKAGIRTRCGSPATSWWSTTRSSGKRPRPISAAASASTTCPRPSEPKLITKWTHRPARGVHRFDFDGRYAYISPTAEGYVGNIVMILDLADPAQPVEVGRWWIPGQWEAGGEEYPVGDWALAALPSSAAHGRPALCQLLAPRLLHPRHLRHGRSRSSSSHLQHEPGLPASDPHLPADAAAAEGPQHHGGGRRGRGQAAAVAAGLHLDLRHHRRDERRCPIATFQVPGLDPDGAPQPPMMGCHQPSERFSGTVMPFAWFAQGLRLVDIADPFAPQRGRLISCPMPPPGADRASSNDVTIDDRGLDLSGRPHPRRRHHRNERLVMERTMQACR